MKTETFAKLIGNIDDKYVESACDKKRRTHIIRYAAAAAAILLVLGAVFAAVKLLPANAPRQDAAVPKEAVLPPARIGTYKDIPWCHLHTWPIDKSFDEAEAVCLIKIGDWLGDNGTGTYFEATVEKLYKGDLPEKIVLYQVASEKMTFELYPVFTYGNELLVFIEKWDKNVDDIDIDDYYVSICEDLTVLYAATAKNGEKYVIDETAFMSMLTEEEDIVHIKNYGYNKDLVRELCEDIAKCDKVIAEQILTHEQHYGDDNPLIKQYVFKLEDLEAFFASR